LAGTALVGKSETLHSVLLTVPKVHLVPGIKSHVDISDVSRVPTDACSLNVEDTKSANDERED
jgi:hypothetical protein